MNTTKWWLLAGALAALGCGGDKDLFDQLGKSDGGKGSNKDGGTKFEDDVCGKHSVVSDHAVPDMLIVLDRSRSMSREGNNRGTDRWGGSVQAVSGLVTKYSMGVNFGLMTFPGAGADGRGDLNNNDPSAPACSVGAVDVPIGEDQGAAISQAISRMRPNGRTPTSATLRAALPVIGSPEVSDQEVTASKFVLLVTDGAPNCIDPQLRGDVDVPAQQATIDEIKALTKAGVKTYVVGYETAGTDFAGQLDLMAAAGGTGETTHRSVASAEDLAATFDELAAYATSCSYRLSETVDAEYVAVTVGGKQRARDNTSDGWRLEADDRTVSLLGKACTDAKNGGAFTVEVQCDPVIGF